jgi:hypothetical protein
MSNPDFTKLIGQIWDFEHLIIPAGRTPWVRNYVSIVREALGCARRDYFQEFRKLSNLDAILDLSRPMWGSHGLREDQAKELVTTYFVAKEG